jgi:hypothetical protein
MLVIFFWLTENASPHVTLRNNDPQNHLFKEHKLAETVGTAVIENVS